MRPLRCHFLHLEITVNGKTAPKVVAGSWSDARRTKKMPEKPQKNGREACKKKKWLYEEMKNRENIKRNKYLS